jgi:hypothetical protein
MDPYLTLGLLRNCTREELKESFRTRARLVHPDRGGEPAAFIRLREAYDQIISELEQRPPGPIAGTSTRPTRDDPRPKPPGPTWEPDLVLLDDEPVRTRPPGAHDPHWQPELILLDEEPIHDRFAESPDPNWEPDLILHDDEPLHGHFSEPRDPRVAWQNYMGWLARVSGHSQHEDPISDETWLNISGVMVLLSVIVLTIWICWSAWTYEPRTEAVDFTTRQQGIHP